MHVTMIKADKAPEALGPYSHATVAGGFAYLSGQIPICPETGEIAEGIEAQTKQSLENCKAVLSACGASLSDVVRVGIFIQDMNQFSKINEIYGQYFDKHKPARSCVEVARLPKDVQIEIEMVACVE